MQQSLLSDIQMLKGSAVLKASNQIPCPVEFLQVSLNIPNKREIVKCIASVLENTLLLGNICTVYLD